MHDPRRHVALRDDPWDEATARAAIQDIVDDALDRFDPQRLWPVHPQESHRTDGACCLYWGAAGVLWALDYLRRQGAVAFDHDLTAALPRVRSGIAAHYVHEAYPDHSSLLFGTVGVDLIAMRLAPDAAIADALFRSVENNLARPILELMWGMPGTMLACVFMAEMTGEVRWRDVYRAQADRLLADLEDTDRGPIWTQALYGERCRYLGPVHGYAGNMLALLRGWSWLDPQQHQRISDGITATLCATAGQSSHGANWPAVDAPGERPVLVQYCHGAPGMVSVFADAPFHVPAVDDVLRAGGDFTWFAGPLAKGSNLCHGTGGNGYALLKLYRRFGTPLWLARARAFAMMAIAQCRAARARYGQGRYSLWTGDIGLAVYLWDCVTAKPRFPTTDVL
ncbi:LanC-like protein [Reyranella sp. CPCC 100927]|uniref:lanthionine synthetase C family protein n=1 Tax=Reyranella sp. CPCC 100927 TaxID=2599616 RepID=UPI0011B5B1B8|nr:LanC-like protein [Reyranella sp. CPCC 100927]TWS97854.1 lanthionine synthetase [Reyranella sp. CPCC 100927]